MRLERKWKEPHGGGAVAVEAACITSGNNHDSASEYAAAVDDEAAGLAVKLQAAVQVGDGGTSPERSSLCSAAAACFSSSLSCAAAAFLMELDLDGEGHDWGR